MDEGDEPAPDFRRWPNSNHNSPAFISDKNLTLEPEDEAHTAEQVAPSIEKILIRESIWRYKCANQDLYKLHPVNLFSASPDVCGKAASLVIRHVAMECRDKRQMRLTHENL